jgi:hypothetical protein
MLAGASVAADAGVTGGTAGDFGKDVENGRGESRLIVSAGKAADYRRIGGVIHPAIDD